MQNICRDLIFPSFVYSMDLDSIDNTAVTNDILTMQQNVESVEISNRGGWHSPSIEKGFETASLIALKNEVFAAVNFVIDKEKLSCSVNNHTYWATVNSKDNYNVMHAHGQLSISAVYYPFIPSDCTASLTFVRTDGGAYLQGHGSGYFSIPCKTNKLVIFSPHLFHFVEPNNSEKKRISIAFNFRG